MVSKDALISVGVSKLGVGVIALVTSLESERKALCSVLILKKCLVRHSGCKTPVI